MKPITVKDEDAAPEFFEVLLCRQELGEGAKPEQVLKIMGHWVLVDEEES